MTVDGHHRNEITADLLIEIRSKHRSTAPHGIDEPIARRAEIEPAGEFRPFSYLRRAVGQAAFTYLCPQSTTLSLPCRRTCLAVSSEQHVRPIHWGMNGEH